MGDDRSEDEDPWFEQLEDSDSGASDPSELSADDEEQSVQSTDQWEWVQPADSPPDRGNKMDGERVWDGFEDENETNAGSDPSGSGAGTDAKSNTERSVGMDRPEHSDTETKETGRKQRPAESTGQQGPSETGSLSPPSADRPSGEEDISTSFPEQDVDTSASETENKTTAERDQAGRGEMPPPPPNAGGQSDDTGIPPPPPATDGHPDDADALPGPTRRDIREMQPLYKRRPVEFYALWLVAALSYGLGDMVTTSVVFVSPQIGESNPIVALVLEQFGLVGFVAMKLGIFGILIAIGVKGAIYDDRLSYYGPPLLAVLVGVGLTVWNFTTILGLGGP